MRLSECSKNDSRHLACIEQVREMRKERSRKELNYTTTSHVLSQFLRWQSSDINIAYHLERRLITFTVYRTPLLLNKARPALLFKTLPQRSQCLRTAHSYRCGLYSCYSSYCLLQSPLEQPAAVATLSMILATTVMQSLPTFSRQTFSSECEILFKSQAMY